MYILITKKMARNILAKVFSSFTAFISVAMENLPKIIFLQYFPICQTTTTRQTYGSLVVFSSFGDS